MLGFFVCRQPRNTKKEGCPAYKAGLSWRGRRGKMKRISRRMGRRGKRNNKKHLNFLQAIRLYLGMPA